MMKTWKKKIRRQNEKFWLSLLRVHVPLEKNTAEMDLKLVLSKTFLQMIWKSIGFWKKRYFGNARDSKIEGEAERGKKQEIKTTVCEFGLV